MTHSKEPEAQSEESPDFSTPFCDVISEWINNLPFELAKDVRGQHACDLLNAINQQACSNLSDQGQPTREQIDADALTDFLRNWMWTHMGTQFGASNLRTMCQAISDKFSPASPVEPRPQPDAAKIRKAALEEAAQLVDCGGCAGVDRLKDGTCVRATSSDCYQVLANEIRSLITADKQEGG